MSDHIYIYIYMFASLTLVSLSLSGPSRAPSAPRWRP